jgi:hypothetical protein
MSVFYHTSFFVRGTISGCHYQVGAMMVFNKMGDYRESRGGRYIGGGRDKSAPTDVWIGFVSFSKMRVSKGQQLTLQ